MSKATSSNSTQPVTTQLLDLCPILKSIKGQNNQQRSLAVEERGTTTSAKVTIMQGICDKIAGLTNVNCTTMLYDPGDGSGTQCILVITLNAAPNFGDIPALKKYVLYCSAGNLVVR